MIWMIRIGLRILVKLKR